MYLKESIQNNPEHPQKVYYNHCNLKEETKHSSDLGKIITYERSDFFFDTNILSQNKME